MKCDACQADIEAGDELQQERATRRHLELTRGARKGGQVFVTRFNTPHDGEDD